MKLAGQSKKNFSLSEAVGIIITSFFVTFFAASAYANTASKELGLSGLNPTNPKDVKKIAQLAKKHPVNLKKVENNMNRIATVVVSKNKDIVKDVKLTASALEALVYNRAKLGMTTESPIWNSLSLELMLSTGVSWQVWAEKISGKGQVDLNAFQLAQGFVKNLIAEENKRPSEERFVQNILSGQCQQKAKTTVIGDKRSERRQLRDQIDALGKTAACAVFHGLLTAKSFDEFIDQVDPSMLAVEGALNRLIKTQATNSFGGEHSSLGKFAGFMAGWMSGFNYSSCTSKDWFNQDWQVCRNPYLFFEVSGTAGFGYGEGSLQISEDNIKLDAAASMGVLLSWGARYFGGYSISGPAVNYLLMKNIEIMTDEEIEETGESVSKMLRRQYEEINKLINSATQNPGTVLELRQN